MSLPVSRQPVARQLPRFLIAGVFGFIVDAGVLYAALALGSGAYAARALSFVSAVITTWWINRRWTFGAESPSPSLREFQRYLSAMLVGGALNYATYALILGIVPMTNWLPLAAVAAGSVAGLAMNFLVARFWVFRKSPQRLVGAVGFAVPADRVDPHSPEPACRIRSR